MKPPMDARNFRVHGFQGSRAPGPLGLFFVIAMALLAAAAWPCAAIERLPLAELRQNLFATCFVSDQEGFMVGDLARIFHTTDGGKTWEYQQTPNKLSLVALSCPDKAHLWASGQAGEIAFSGDSGKTWQLQQSGVERQLLSIAFANPQRGLAVGDFGTLLRTENGGVTWNKVALPTDVRLPPDVAEVVDPGDIVLYSVTFADAEHAWAVGEFGVILASGDGGASWQQQTNAAETSLFGVSFADPRRGWAVGIDATLLATTDGGTTWRQETVETPKGIPLSLYDIQVRGTYGWAVGNSGFLLNSKDAGATWQLVNVPVQMGSSWLRGLTLFPDGRGFIVGARGLVLSADRDTFTPSKKRL
jgi:photosystem II stability/assembly factor-like uncharacterized protein